MSDIVEFICSWPSDRPFTHTSDQKQLAAVSMSFSPDLRHDPEPAVETSDRSMTSEHDGKRHREK